MRFSPREPLQKQSLPSLVSGFGLMTRSTSTRRCFRGSGRIFAALKCPKYSPLVQRFAEKRLSGHVPSPSWLLSIVLTEGYKSICAAPLVSNVHDSGTICCLSVSADARDARVRLGLLLLCTYVSKARPRRTNEYFARRSVNSPRFSSSAISPESSADGTKEIRRIYRDFLPSGTWGFCPLRAIGASPDFRLQSPDGQRHRLRKFQAGEP